MKTDIFSRCNLINNMVEGLGEEVALTESFDIHRKARFILNAVNIEVAIDSLRDDLIIKGKYGGVQKGEVERLVDRLENIYEVYRRKAA
jgi:hypothetical protein